MKGENRINNTILHYSGSIKICSRDKREKKEKRNKGDKAG